MPTNVYNTVQWYNQNRILNLSNLFFLVFLNGSPLRDSPLIKLSFLSLSIFLLFSLSRARGRKARPKMTPFWDLRVLFSWVQAAKRNKGRLYGASPKQTAYFLRGESNIILRKNIVVKLVYFGMTLFFLHERKNVSKSRCDRKNSFFLSRVKNAFFCR